MKKYVKQLQMSISQANLEETARQNVDTGRARMPEH